MTSLTWRRRYLATAEQIVSEMAEPGISGMSCGFPPEGHAPPVLVIDISWSSDRAPALQQ